MDHRTHHDKVYPQPLWRAWFGSLLSSENIKSIVLGVAIALVIRTFIVQVYKIPSGSMRPTLMEGDRIIVSKFTYRFREPQPGEVIIFRYPEDRKREFIKRLIGRGGDTIAIRNERLVVNDRVREDAPFKAFQYLNRGTLTDPQTVITVPPGMYFVLGDNSASSRDSRYWGFVPKNDLVGKALVIFWPLHRWKVIR